MILRLVAWLLVFLGISWFVRNLFRPARPRRDGSARGRAPDHSAGLLVRDEVCSTYVPKERARVLREPSGEEHYFCSEACESKYLSSRSASPES